MPEPVAPHEGFTDTDLAYFILDLRNAGASCRDVVGAVRGLQK